MRDHTGVVALANGGILFLDELAELPNPLQAKLLRTLESGEYRPLGSNKVLRSEFRILAATSADPEGIMAS
ncbi:MAG TPA: sigma 54-interacting transcriptional regulator, partial [Gemmatimonadales bacterium]